MTFAARKYRRRLLTYDFVRGRGKGGWTSLFWNTHIFRDRWRSLLEYYNHFHVFSIIRIYLYIFLTSWIFIPLLVFSLLVTALLCSPTTFLEIAVYRSLDQSVLGMLLFCAQFACRLTSGQSGRTKEPLARPGAFKQSGHFLWSRILGKAQELPICHKLVKC